MTKNDTFLHIFRHPTLALAASYICPRCSHLVWVFVTHRSEFIKAVVTAWVSYWGKATRGKRSSFSQQRICMFWRHFCFFNFVWELSVTKREREKEWETRDKQMQSLPGFENREECSSLLDVAFSNSCHQRDLLTYFLTPNSQQFISLSHPNRFETTVRFFRKVGKM